jgi:hypothetical protein
MNCKEKDGMPERICQQFFGGWKKIRPAGSGRQDGAGE